MTLADDLARAQTEEDVKDAYIKALGIKLYYKGLVDIRTDEVWFEAKDSSTPSLIMIGQLLVYVRNARQRGEPIPAFLCVFDREKAAILSTEKALPVLSDVSIEWPATGSKATKALADQLRPHLSSHITEYAIAKDTAAFLEAMRSIFREKKIIRTAVTPHNLRQVFDRWVENVGNQLGVERQSDHAVLFFADLMHDGESESLANLPARLLFNGKRPVFVLRGQMYEPVSLSEYDNFWRLYERPPVESHRHYLLERREQLLPLDEQKFKGAYYTPLHIVSVAYDELSATLGEDWQDRYIVWDMCAGVGNLEAKHNNLHNVFMSTLDEDDVAIMRANPTFAGATIFQYDYLNDDVSDFGDIDYDLSNKLPPRLRQAIAAASAGDGDAKPILVLINPPYGEAANTLGNAGKTGIAATRLSAQMSHLSFAARELFVQFLHRIMRELPSARVAMFSTLKYINAPNFSKFRSTWDARFLSGFIVPSQVFDGTTGSFPVGFLIWDLSVRKKVHAITVSVRDRRGRLAGEKTLLDEPNTKLLSHWIDRSRTNSENVPLKNAVTAQNGHAKVTAWSADSIGYLYANSNDLQNAGTKTAILSSVYSAGNGFHVTRDNLARVGIVFAVRMLIRHTWINHNDQFLQPLAELPSEFEDDCLVWTLFSGKNLTAGANNIQWSGRRWTLINHFVPFTAGEMGAKGSLDSHLMVDFLRNRKLSPEAAEVLRAGKDMFKKYHSTTFPKKIVDELHLGRADAGWYQVRNALKAYGASEPVDFAPFEEAFAALSSKLRPQVYEYGFLPR